MTAIEFYNITKVTLENMAKYRQGRLNEAVANELSIALGEVRDPRVNGALISITRAEVTPDLKQARVYFSTMDDAKEVAEGLKKETLAGRHRYSGSGTRCGHFKPQTRYGI